MLPFRVYKITLYPREEHIADIRVPSGSDIADKSETGDKCIMIFWQYTV